MRSRDHLLDGAVRQQHAIGDVGDLMTALGLVHVMSRDQRGEPLGGERMDLVPELAPRLGINSRGRLVEQQQLRIGQGASAERKSLLPPPDSSPASCSSRPASPSRAIIAWVEADAQRRCLDPDH
jgi:hypothetical protein